MRRKPGKHAATFVLITVLIDSMGIGIVLPVLPNLIQELTGLSLSEAAFWGGFLAVSYAIMQFLMSPTIGNLSDRFGRRPVLLASLATLTVNYVIMALSPVLWLLFVGRIVSGAAGATHATANAYMADISPPEKRAQNFAMVSAAFGIGFIIGPVIGGLAGEISPRAPFLVAALLCGLNLIYGAIVLPETLSADRRRPFVWARANPVGVLHHILQLPMIAWFLLAYAPFQLSHHVYPAIWAFFSQEAFGWTTADVGVSLAVFGISMAIIQGWLIRIILARIGAVSTAWVGFAVSAMTLAGLAVATQGWVAYLIVPFSALGVICTPALTSLMSNRIPDDAQGELQGVLTSITAITTIITPLLMTQLFGHFTGPTAPVYFPGAPFLAASIAALLAMVPFAIGLRRRVSTA